MAAHGARTASAVPVIGFLNVASPDGYRPMMAPSPRAPPHCTSQTLKEPNHVLLVNDKDNYRRNDRDQNQELALFLCHRFTTTSQGITRQRNKNEPLGSARLEAAEPDRAACPTLGSVERSGFGFDDLLREQKHLDHPLAGVHGEYLKLIGRQRVQPLLERRRAFQCIFEAMGLGEVVNRLVVLYSSTPPLRSIGGPRKSSITARSPGRLCPRGRPGLPTDREPWAAGRHHRAPLHSPSLGGLLATARQRFFDSSHPLQSFLSRDGSEFSGCF